MWPGNRCLLKRNCRAKTQMNTQKSCPACWAASASLLLLTIANI
nr:MAG TPA: PRO CATHEPSIN B S9 [Caudoviricetes sp.]